MGEQKKYDVICIGQAVQDILTTNVPKNAFMMETDTVKADSLTITTGGDAVNEAIILSRLGNKSSVVVRLDNRNVGDMIYQELKDENVDVSLVSRQDDCENFTSMIFIHPDGDHDFIVGPGKNYMLSRSDVDFSVFSKARAVSAGSLFTLGELDTNGIEEIFKIAQDSGAYTFADANFDLKGIGPDAIKGVYPYTDYIIPSLNEAMYMTGKKNVDDIADWFLAHGVKNVMLKLGSKGCFFKNKDERFFEDPYEITPVDPTGCGDNFAAAFIHGVLHGMTHKECAEFACGAGGLNSQGIGAHMYIKSEQQIRDFMAKTPKRDVKR